LWPLAASASTKWFIPSADYASLFAPFPPDAAAPLPFDKSPEWHVRHFSPSFPAGHQIPPLDLVFEFFRMEAFFRADLPQISFRAAALPVRPPLPQSDAIPRFTGASIGVTSVPFQAEPFFLRGRAELLSHGRQN